LVYATLQKVMNDAGLEVSNEEMVHWHGASKTEVVSHFVMDRLKISDESLCTKIDEQFEIQVQEAYFSDNSPVRLIHPELLDAFANLRASGCKVALNTGYPKKIQLRLIEKLGLMEHIDAAVCATEVEFGRPYPYMVQLAMTRCHTMDARTVAKAGDTSRDIEEGLHAGCGLAMGVLTGAGTKEGLTKAGADLVLPNIVEFVNMRTNF